MKKRILKVGSFKSRVLAIVSGIPKGQTLTYKQVAEAAGSPRAARAVGNIMKGNHDKNIKCHRVIKSDGSLGGYNRGAKRKRALLEAEGVRPRHN